MKGILISLVVCVSFLFASNPVEPAKRTLFVYQHGLGNDPRGAVSKNCDMEEGSASTTFNSPGNHEYLIGDVVAFGNERKRAPFRSLFFYQNAQRIIRTKT
ncbi:MAG: hypothetical protein J6Y56_06195 [Fibrobacterales bacterium]|nr:hypothetical protein [Fibrobacterales bacterium]